MCYESELLKYILNWWLLYGYKQCLKWAFCFFNVALEFRSTKPPLLLIWLSCKQHRAYNGTIIKYSIFKLPALPVLPLSPTSSAHYLWNHLFEIVCSVNNCLIANFLKTGENKAEQIKASRLFGKEANAIPHSYQQPGSWPQFKTMELNLSMEIPKSISDCYNPAQMSQTVFKKFCYSNSKVL